MYGVPWKLVKKDSLVCFLIAKPLRGQGLTVRLIEAVVAYAQSQGARVVEGYPVEPKKAPMPAVFAATGFAVSFRGAGFVEVARRSETRPVMRYFVG